MGHLLNLRELAGEHVDDFDLLGFEGREAMSECFEWRLELIPVNRHVEPDLTKWIGQLLEFDISPDLGEQRVFAGRIYAARWVEGIGMRRLHVLAGPAFHATNYGRATHFMQDMSTLDIFDGLTKDVPGMVSVRNVSAASIKRGYAMRYDETEYSFLSRLLAQDAIGFFFVYDRSAGSYRHRMVLTDSPQSYVDVSNGPIYSDGAKTRSSIDMMERRYGAAARSQGAVALDVAKLDSPFLATFTARDSWGAVYSHTYDRPPTEAKTSKDSSQRIIQDGAFFEQGADRIEGSSVEPALQAGGRFTVAATHGDLPGQLALTSVVHSAYDPWMLDDKSTATYHNRFTAIDATVAYRPPLEPHVRQAPGPILGTITHEGKAAGEAVIDQQWRVPVSIAKTHDFITPTTDGIVWLPVQQQWAQRGYGAQFFPRIGARVIIDFLYGNPDLPFIAGSMYTPSEAYPFDPNTKATQSGWRSITDKQGAVTQEFRFEDKPGHEEIYLYTGRDYRRIVDKNDWGTVKQNQTLEVWNDQKQTIGHDQKWEVKNDRTTKVTGKQVSEVLKTRTMTVTKQSKHESFQEIELKVGPSTIKLTMQGIEIKAPMIKIDASAQLEMKAGAMAMLTAPLIQEKADGPMIIGGGIVMIN